MSSKELRNMISNFSQVHVLVIGDTILDTYLKGQSTRLTPEAPVPVVDISEKRSMLGGAGNTACNLIHLGAKVSVCTVVGDDEAGKRIKSLFDDISVDTRALLIEKPRLSLTKTRIISSGQVITRFDEGDTHAISPQTENDLIAVLHQSIKECDAIILSDYNKGLFTGCVIEAIEALRQRFDKPIMLDSKRLNFFSSLRIALAKPNYYEAISLIGISPVPSGRANQIEQCKDLLFSKVHANIIAVTLDGEGSIFMQKTNAVSYLPAYKIENPHVSGAGDTFLSAATLAFVTSNDLGVAQHVANAAAAIAISKTETSHCTAEELISFFPEESKAIYSLADLAHQCQRYRRQGKKIVLTNGCFDILHSGHVTYLHCAKDLGDILIVGMNNDESIKRLKGADRPINSLDDRMKVISGLSSVDHVVPFGSEVDDTPIELVRVIRPDVFVKGGDYSKDRLPEARAVEEAGGKIVFIPFIPNHSTTMIIQKIVSNRNHESEKVGGH